MRILVSGASGLIGSALIGRFKQDGGNEIIRLVRSRSPLPGEIAWDPQAGQLDPAALEGFDVVVHLAGENVAGRWTEEKKARIRNSRIRGAQLLCERLVGLAQRPKVLLSASAIGYYGDRGDAVLDENGAAGGGFLASVCRDWEAATEPAAAAGIRVMHTRFGVVVATQGGALASMLPIFRLGMGGRLGNGRQYVSWVSLDDAVRAVVFLMSSESLAGPLNVTAPEPVTNARFAQALAQAVHRPAILPVPKFALRIMAGEMADEMLLSSTRAVPARLTAAGFSFGDRTIEHALQRILPG